MRIEVIHGDITKVNADVIVNAANTSLLGGGGVDGAIHKAGGSEILDECIEIRNKQGGCKVGEAVITTAGNLNARRVIHTVGPKWNDGIYNEAELLRKCYLNSLKLAEEYKLSVIAFPNISTGIYGFPKQKAAKIAHAAVTGYEAMSLEQILFVCFDDENYRLYTKLFSEQ
ncbi:MAG: O-acetyl-ADP-ribose deacetylase [Bacteroidia bacterium]|nr:O-acetyl-ADP-ribose deacetylase [Bacteroidia bacterium]NNF30362.1 O-acetyl-ADP-ribose deacetylase [Flavobacteriaceae bacterium]MBT8276438.1 O-acetyl-ADP-ribose deacetylase [Bacteroidia bacterium]NNJ82853.1 O-acetyl-ADP-ribose deacetylase [Flavobacteriaceae bacterium]NNK53493.1 O-acetyl-ADP-ribose deacetylase [Flavobacteriaceae bacterium]